MDEDRIAELENLHSQVLNLKDTGNDRESAVALVKITTTLTLADALIDIESI